VQYLDENKQLILAILDNQNLGKLNECATYASELAHAFEVLRNARDWHGCIRDVWMWRRDWGLSYSR
jgi:hypothetical protein